MSLVSRSRGLVVAAAAAALLAAGLPAIAAEPAVAAEEPATDYTAFVNPFVSTEDDFGQDLVGAEAPNSIVEDQPDDRCRPVALGVRLRGRPDRGLHAHQPQRRGRIRRGRRPPGRADVRDVHVEARHGHVREELQPRCGGGDPGVLLRRPRDRFGHDPRGSDDRRAHGAGPIHVRAGRIRVARRRSAKQLHEPQECEPRGCEPR